MSIQTNVNVGFGVAIDAAQESVLSRIEDESFYADFFVAYPLLSFEEAGMHMIPNDPSQSYLVVITDTIAGLNPVGSSDDQNALCGVLELSSIQINPEAYHQLKQFCEDFQIQRPVGAIVWNHIS